MEFLGNIFTSISKNFTSEQKEFAAKREKDFAELDAFIMSQEFEPCYVEDNPFLHPCLQGSDGTSSETRVDLNPAERFAVVLLTNILRNLRKNELIPDYEILFEILKKLLITKPTTFDQDYSDDIVFQEKSDSKCEISRIKVEFDMGSLLGQGGYGSVFNARSRLDCKEYAIKKIKILSHATRDTRLREVRVLSNLNHQNVVRYHCGWLDYEIDDNTWSEISSGNENSGCGENTVCWSTESSGIIQLVPINNPKLGLSVPVRSNSSASLDLLRAGNIVSTLTNLVVSQNKFAAQQKTISEDEVKPDIQTQKTYAGDSTQNHQILDIAPDHPGEIQILCIQLELCEMSLKEWLIQRNTRCPTFQKFLESDLVNSDDYTNQLIQGLYYIHSKGYMHRDIKPANLMLTENCKVLKIGDFGLSKEAYNIDSPDTKWPIGPNHTSRRGTPIYSSPEQYYSREYTDKTDIFSSGLVMLELYCPSINDEERCDKLEDLREGQMQTDFKENFPFESDLILKMVELDWEKRPSADEVLSFLSFKSRQTEKDLKRIITVKEKLLVSKDKQIAELEAKIEKFTAK